MPRHTVDGRNSAPVGRWCIPLESHYLQYFRVPNRYQLVQDFFYPQYHRISPTYSRQQRSSQGEAPNLKPRPSPRGWILGGKSEVRKKTASLIIIYTSS